MKVGDFFGYLILVGIAVVMIFGILAIFRADYKQGQIDAINGIIKYELVKQADGSVEWESIND